MVIIYVFNNTTLNNFVKANIKQQDAAYVATGRVTSTVVPTWGWL